MYIFFAVFKVHFITIVKCLPNEGISAGWGLEGRATETRGII